jgi:predicted nucleic acid-binding protein
MQLSLTMEKNVIDTNLIIRFLVNDDLQKVIRIEKLLHDKKLKKVSRMIAKEP